MDEKKKLVQVMQAANQESKRLNDNAFLTSRVGKMIGWPVLAVSVIDTLPDLARETLSLSRNWLDLLGIAVGTGILGFSYWLSNNAKSAEKDIHDSRVTIAIIERHGEITLVDQEGVNKENLNNN